MFAAEGEGGANADTAAAVAALDVGGVAGRLQGEVVTGAEDGVFAGADVGASSRDASPITIYSSQPQCTLCKDASTRNRPYQRALPTRARC